ncbi:YlbL family protein [Paenibacillus sp.]|uniref:YlbL family protein n=1 Tax=Paenibacillus sp. TaxID=58172 RepID=UPI002D73005E|nr:PDZ domain-containing protein [Paenibacillus sp.]HZG57838.1 PDZ domain-containing protein [Paenibacillus sp.]
MNRKSGLWLLPAIALTAAWFVPTPYYLYQPGTMEELSAKVEVEGGDRPEGREGFYLTTVLSLKASNVFYYIYGLLAPDTELRAEEDVLGDLSAKEYDALLRHMMSASQATAVHAGFALADEPIRVEREGLFVTWVEPESGAAGKLRVGDLIVEAGGAAATTLEQVRSAYAGGQAGDAVDIVFLREGKRQAASVPLYADADGDVRLGIEAEEALRVATDRRVVWRADDIGGPSAGLMFALEVYDQATPGRLTRGYRVAGTGTMDMEGEVGQIGGIRQKVVAAAREGADVFFVPADVQADDRNAAEALAEAAARGYTLDVVPVRTLAEAVAYLSGLPERP